jgi:hypothetical protein
MKDAAADLTHLTDEVLEHVMHESRAERLRIQREAGGTVGIAPGVGSVKKWAGRMAALSLFRREGAGPVAEQPSRPRTPPTAMSAEGNGRRRRTNPWAKP